MKNAAAVILCAGKGTRMNDDSKNKVCFDCAGIPVIKRIIAEMKKGGVESFVLVVGHQAESVMNCLSDIDGIAYAFQKEQKGTGHAALCGLNVLSSLGYSGPVIVSMGDKIVDSSVVSDLISRSGNAKAVWGVQPINANKNGGRVVVKDGKPYGIVEFADAALMSLAGVPEGERKAKLDAIGLNEKKSERVLKAAKNACISGKTTLCGEEFTADEILATEFANAGLYCFDTDSVIEAIGRCGSSNAQGEIYITDTLEDFASRGEAALYTVEKREAMLTYSTKNELREMSRYFMRNASDIISDIKRGNMREEFVSLYGDSYSEQEARYVALLEHFIAQYGDKKVIITRSPGRVNLMGRHIDHRGGFINVMAIDKDTVFVAAPRSDDRVNITNLEPVYKNNSFSVSESLSLADNSDWLSYISSDAVSAELADSRGDWCNYVKSAVLRFAMASDISLCGMDLAACGNIPAAAGLSSSSSIVVAVAEAVVALNCLNITEREFIDLCGEGEWYVGSRGGAGDHAAMKCSRRGRITQLGFKPFCVGDSAGFSDDYAIIVANSKLTAKKSEGSKDKFNAKVAAYEFAFMLLKRAYPEYDLREFRDLAAIENKKLYKMLLSIPEFATRKEISAMLPEYKESIERIFATHAEPETYELRGVALYGVSECARAAKCMKILGNGDYRMLGELMKISHDGDRLTDLRITDEYLERLISDDADICLQSGAYGCSVPMIDSLCDLLNSASGVLGSELVGAGLGGCVIALVEKAKADSVIELINKEYYDKNGFEHSANVYMASCGSTKLF